VPVVEDLRLEIAVAEGVKVNACYGIPDSLRDRPRFTVPMGDMNVDEWRILIFEIEGDPVRWESHPLEARMTYRIHGQSARQSQAATAELAMEAPGGAKPTVNKYVSRNSALLATALGLRKIGELAQAGKYGDAIEIVLQQYQKAVEWARSNPDDYAAYLEEETTVPADVWKAIYDSRKEA